MYAVIETGGKQYKVAEGDTIAVEKLETPVGDSVEIPAVRLVVDGDKVVADKKKLDKVKVLGTVTAHKRGTKIRVFKMKRRKGYRRTKGHRQELTEILVTAIKTEKARKKS
jgi:large subunit ribosomal protein L21